MGSGIYFHSSGNGLVRTVWFDECTEYPMHELYSRTSQPITTTSTSYPCKSWSEMEWVVACCMWRFVINARPAVR